MAFLEQESAEPLPPSPPEPQPANPLSDELEAARRRIAELEAQIPPPAPEAPPESSDGIPDVFRGLMLDGESAERFTERMRRRWQALKHLQIDGTKPTNARALPDMTPEESEELADLERRNSQHKWLD
jgi:hypothetical protein